jgi:hypothetical protein
MDEQQIAEQIKALQEIKKENKQVDVAALALAALHQHEANMLTPGEKRWGYLVSISLPPVGLIYALKFYASGKDDGKQAAYMCLGLTAAAIISFIILGNVMFAGSGLTTTQLKQAPSDLQQLVQ